MSNLKIYSTEPNGNEAADLEHALYMNMAIDKIKEESARLKGVDTPIQIMLAHIDILLHLSKKFEQDAELLILSEDVNDWRKRLAIGLNGLRKRFRQNFERALKHLPIASSQNWTRSLLDENMWGNEPWDNDAAADWFGKLLDKTDLPKHVRKTLLLSKEDDPYGENTAELRAAAYCVLQLGRVYIWPIASLKEDLQIAINALEMVLSNEDYCYSTEIKDQIGAEKRELTSRLDRLKQASG